MKNILSPDLQQEEIEYGSCGSNNGPEGRSCCVSRVELLRSLLPVRYGKVKVMKNILVPTLFLQVQESSRYSHRRLRYGST